MTKPKLDWIEPKRRLINFKYQIVREYIKPSKTPWTVSYFYCRHDPYVDGRYGEWQEIGKARTLKEAKAIAQQNFEDERWPPEQMDDDLEEIANQIDWSKYEEFSDG